MDCDENSQSRAELGETEAIVVADSTAKLASDTAIRLDAVERRLLARMPLHAITSVLGEALALASRLHARDRRQREPYANHLLRVTIRILSHYRVSDLRWCVPPCCTMPSRTTRQT